jgi:metallo-beta-lactamase class B
VLLLALLAFTTAQAQDHWKRPFPAHKIAGNVHYVGTEDLACFLITTPEGHILINTGLTDSVPLIRDSTAKLGFKFEDIRILLTMQAHYDHVAGLAEIKKITGAKLFATEADAPVLEDGGKSDPVLGERGWFAPVKVDRRLKDGETIRLGGTELVVHLTPGHTKGSVSYSMQVRDSGKPHSLFIVNMGTVVMPLVGNTNYPQIVEDFARSFAKQKTWKPDIWVAGHATQYGMRVKLQKNSFVDPDGFLPAVERLEKAYLEQLARERRQRQ